MAWIKTVDESEATGLVKEHYEEAMDIWGFVPNIRKAHSIKPRFMKQLHEFSQAVTRGGSSLGREREEMLAVMISALLKCRY